MQGFVSRLIGIENIIVFLSVGGDMKGREKVSCFLFSVSFLSMFLPYEIISSFGFGVSLCVIFLGFSK